MPPNAGPAHRPARPLRALVAVALLAGALTACGGGNSSDSGSTSIVVTHGYTDAEATALKAAADTWNQQHPDQKVTLQFNGGNDSALQKTVAGFTAGNYPDVAYQYGSSASQLVRQPKLVDLTDRVTAPAVDWNDFFPAAREATTVDGKVVGVPALIDNLSLVYNKAMFARAGVAPPTNDWTWQDFRDAAAKLTDASTKTYGWAYVNDGSEDTVWRYLALLWQAGGDLLNADNTAPAFDSAAGKAALQQLEDIAMLWTGPWDLSSINSDVKYGVTYLPGFNGNHETISGPDLFMLFDHSGARADSAFDFVTWLTSAKQHIKFSIATGDLPLRQSETTLPGYQTFLKKFPAEKVFVSNLDNVKHVRPNIASYAEVSTIIGTMVQSVLLGQATPDAALSSASSQVASVLAGS
jgi:multiple sugar transport system substrate-binding protein